MKLIQICKQNEHTNVVHYISLIKKNIMPKTYSSECSDVVQFIDSFLIKNVLAEEHLW